MGTAKSRMIKVAPVSLEEEMACSIGGDSHGQFFSPSNKTNVLIRNCTDCNSDGQESEFSAEDATLAEVDRIIAECDNTDEKHNNRTYKMPTLGSKSSGLYHAKRHASNEMYSGTHAKLQHDVSVKNYEDNAVVKPTTVVQERMSPLKSPLCSTNTENISTALPSYGTSGAPSLSLPIMYDASDEDLMNTIEREFG